MTEEIVFFSPKSLPVMAATRSKPNRPTSSQFTAPMITSSSEIVLSAPMQAPSTAQARSGSGARPQVRGSV